MLSGASRLGRSLGCAGVRAGSSSRQVLTHVLTTAKPASCFHQEIMGRGPTPRKGTSPLGPMKGKKAYSLPPPWPWRGRAKAQ